MLHNYCKPSAQSSARENFFQKILSRGKLSKYYTSRMLYIPLYPTNLQIFGTKSLLRRRFLQHYCRDTFIESHRKPTDVLEMSYSGRLTSSIFIPRLFIQISPINHHLGIITCTCTFMYLRGHLNPRSYNQKM